MTRRHTARPLRWTVAAVMLGVAACARVDPQPQWQALQGIAEERTGVTPVWERSDADAATMRAQVDTLLADGLSRDDAVRIALSNNRMLQATFQEIGIAKADLVQAGLLSNPSLDILLMFPLNLDNTSASFLAMLSDLWTVPARERIAALGAEGVIRRVGIAVVDTATTAANCYDEMLYRAASLELERDVLKMRTDAAVRTQTQYDRGETNELDVVRARSEILDQEIAVARAERDLVVAHSQLDLLLSLADDQRQYVVTSRLDAPEGDEWTVETAVPFALEHRLDVAAARLRVDRSQQQLSYERTQVFRNVAIGPGYTGGLGSSDSGGPVLDLEIPLFDQNQAQIAKAQYRLQQAELMLAAAQQRTRADVEDALAEIAFRETQVAIIRDRLEPLRARAVGYTEDGTAQMHLTYLDLLHARAQEVGTHREHLAALWQLRRAEVRLQRVLWSSGDLTSPGPF